MDTLSPGARFGLDTGVRMSIVLLKSCMRHDVSSRHIIQHDLKVNYKTCQKHVLKLFRSIQPDVFPEILTLMQDLLSTLQPLALSEV